MSPFLFLASTVSWGQAYTCASSTQLSCTIDPAAAVAGGASVLAHVRIVNNTVTSDTCFVDIATSLGAEAPSVQIVNTPPTSGFVAPNGGVLEFDVELSVDAVTDATTGKKILVDVSNELPLCSAEQWLCIIPESETTFSLSAPPAASGFPPASNGGWGFIMDDQPKHHWGAELQPTTADFTGRKIREFEAMEADDACWYTDGRPTLPEVKKARLTIGPEWTVENGRFYASDLVGWHNAYVNFYRGHVLHFNVDHTPCKATLPQQLQMMCKRLPDNADYWVPYHDQDLVWGNNDRCAVGPASPYVSSERGAECMDKSW